MDVALEKLCDSVEYSWNPDARKLYSFDAWLHFFRKETRLKGKGKIRTSFSNVVLHLANIKLLTFYFYVRTGTVFVVKIVVKKNVSSGRWAQRLVNWRLHAWVSRNLWATRELWFAIGLVVIHVQIYELVVGCWLITLLEIARRLFLERLHVCKPFWWWSEFQLCPSICKVLTDDEDNADGYNND